MPGERAAGERVSASVYLVMRGSYSDREVVAVFSTPEKAEAFAAEFAGDRCGIQTYALDGEPEETFVTTVCMDRDGGVEHTHASRVGLNYLPMFYFLGVTPKREPDGYYVVGKLRTTDPNVARRENIMLGRSDMTTDVRTASRERAIKVANERRALLLANEAWGDEAKARQILGLAP